MINIFRMLGGPADLFEKTNFFKFLNGSIKSIFKIVFNSQENLEYIFFSIFVLKIIL